MIVILQRGAQDGLHALVPWADPDYRRLRPRLALPRPGSENGVLDLDGAHGLHPRLPGMAALFAQGELLAVPAIATRYRERSHFDAQNLLENGTGKAFGADDGWLNRALAGFGDPDARLGMALGYSVPLLLQGAAPLVTWAPSVLPPVDPDFLGRLSQVYADDPAFAAALTDALAMPPAPPADDDAETQRSRAAQSLSVPAKAAAAALAAPQGPRVALLESNGWDTHQQQGARLNVLFADLDAAIATLRDGLGAAWAKTVIVTISEFGRTAAENGGASTDHGTGGTSFVLGGAVRGGRIVGDWPGLSDGALYAGRDVAPANATEAMLKGLLIGHLGLPEAHVEDVVFPGSRALRPFLDLTRR